MPSIRKLPSGKYYCQVRVQGRKPLYKAFTKETDALAWGKEQECIAKYSVPYDKPISQLGDDTFKDIGLRYCVTVLRGKPSQKVTELRIDRMSSHFLQPFKKITKLDVNNYRLMRLQQVSPTTCRDELLFLSRVFKWVKSELLLEIENPCEGIAIPKANKPRDKVVTAEELQQLLNVMSPEMGVIVELAWETAMRRSEIFKLSPRCLHLEERLLDVIDGKTGSRSVPLTSRAVELLLKAQEGCVSSTSRLFKVAPCSVTQALRRARRQLGMSEDIRFHQLRHSRISLVAKKGFNQAQIMAVSGHRDSRSVQRYTHLNVSDVIGLLD